jgi:RNA polymerase sigma-70 factor (ECF subfamily)
MASVTERQRLGDFERAVLPHMNAAYNLARWLTRNDADAQDVVQEACLRAFRYYAGFAGENPKAWLLTILRNTCFSWLAKNRPADLAPLDEALSDSVALADEGGPQTPEREFLAADDRGRLDRLIAGLPAEFREVIVLREQEEMSYREISEITAVPVGTVMSRLARGRARLREGWERQHAPKTGTGMRGSHGS